MYNYRIIFFGKHRRLLRVLDVQNARNKTEALNAVKPYMVEGVRGYILQRTKIA